MRLLQTSLSILVMMTLIAGCAMDGDSEKSRHDAQTASDTEADQSMNSGTADRAIESEDSPNAGAQQNNNKNHSQEDDQVNSTDFINAAELGDTDKVLTMLEQGIDINVTDERGRTAILAATYGNKPDTVEALIQKGADLNLRDQRSDNPLLYAGAEGRPEIVKLMVEAGADTTLTNRFGGTALIPAADRGHVQIVEYLLEHSDVDIDHINNLGWTALLEAVILGDGGERHTQIVKLLVEHGADVNLADGEGVSPLAHAKSRNYTDIIAILENAGAK
ncbi:ankyrin repeat domain-containing protein [Paenibacillus shunpengii]|uniref:Ankyrin repeat domain-containing protein n=1 Tax=Paenibacillus shunpengii TaxID=2054424 RepID=A0ABW5SQA6_9BACL|nr:hypothetical protein SAMN05518848_105384 [Paenibacillus sp. PDC88]